MDSRGQKSFALNNYINFVGIILLLDIYQPITINYVDASIGLGNKVRKHVILLCFPLICVKISRIYRLEGVDYKSSTCIFYSPESGVSIRKLQ
jgi:hypothetical protein